MAVKKQKTTRGITKYFHYRFMSKGKLYQGVCKGCSTEKAALKYELEIREKVDELSKQKNVKALVENFRDEMTGGSEIFLSDAFDLSLKKPRKRQPAKRLIDSKRSYWRDFVDFMETHYPDIKKLNDVCESHAGEYIQYIREHGRYNKRVQYKSGSQNTEYFRSGNLSNKSCNTFHQTLNEVFDLLFKDAGLIENPFAEITKLNNESESREAFTEEELRLISEKADDFIKPIFVIGIATALREGDICTLKWIEVNLKSNIIRREMLKTRRIVEIPILPPLRRFLCEQQMESKESEYVLPEHAEMYLNNRSGITWRVKKFLESIGITTTKIVPGRTRAISIKDVHSLRHTFCYYAGVYGIPLLVVKDIVGHVSEQMTELYQKHADNQAKREKLMLMPDFMGLDVHTPAKLSEAVTEPERDQLVALAQTSDIVKIRAALKILKN